MIDLNMFPQDKKYLVAVSGGPDSMALLDILYHENYSLIVVHVNYHTRKESDLEEQNVISYCKNHHLNYFIYQCNKKDKIGNFEAWARNERYTFFQKIYFQEKADGIFVAHHKDDLLETYLMQKKRNNLVSYYGLNGVSEIYGMKVCRPLLALDKSDLLKYCENHHLVYSIDCTNFDNHYVRNKIRNTIIPNLSELEKENLINEIKEKNKYLVDLKNRYQSFFLEEKHHLNCFSNLSIFDIQILLFTLIKRKNPECNKLSKSQVQEILDVLNSSKPNVIFSLGKNLSLIKEYDEWMISEDKIAEDYEYIISSPSKIDVEQFSCDLRGDLSFFKIYNDSYPLKIRNAKKDDVVYFGDVKKKINRIFIDEKIPLLKRKSYPIIQDKNEKIVYIPLYGSKEQKNIANKLQFVLK